MSELTMDELTKRGEAVLKHYGKKGMKWGVRSSLSETYNPGLSKSRTTAIKKARSNVEVQKTKIKSSRTPETKAKRTRALKEDPNYVAARLRTRGEKAAGAVLSVAGTVSYFALAT